VIKYRQAYGPVGAPLSGVPEQLFSRQVYFGGALVLYALRQQVGDAAFQRIERAWVSRYRDGVASTRDFIRLASRVSGQDLTQFLNAWIYCTTTPPMPGHPVDGRAGRGDRALPGDAAGAVPGDTLIGARAGSVRTPPASDAAAGR
jgi:hypothetical protein